MSFVDFVGYAAALAVLGSFCMNTIVPLRILAVVSNVLFGLYGVLSDLYPVFFLHSVLLPVNLFKLATILLPINLFKPARRRSISQAKRLSRWAAPLTALVFAVPTLAPTIAKAQEDVFDAANLYPGRSCLSNLRPV